MEPPANPGRFTEAVQRLPDDRGGWLGVGEISRGEPAVYPLDPGDRPFEQQPLGRERHARVAKALVPRRFAEDQVVRLAVEVGGQAG